MGARYLRKLLVVGMTSVIGAARRANAGPAFAWARELLERRPARLDSSQRLERVKMISILFADLHQGQRSWSRDEKAGHMTAPDHRAKTSTNSLAKQEPSTHANYSFAIALR